MIEYEIPEEYLSGEIDVPDPSEYMDEIPEGSQETQDDTPRNITQETLISYLISNEDVWALCAPIIDESYFEPQYRSVIKYIFHHTETYKQIPEPAMIEMNTGLVFILRESATDPRTRQWIIDECEKFCRAQAARNEIVRAAKIVNENPSRDAMEAILHNMRAIVEMGVAKDIGIEIHRDGVAVLADDESVKKESSGWIHLDDVTGGGFPRPCLVMFAGKSGFGKTVSLINVAVNMSNQGKNVVYISLELSQDRINHRAIGMISNIALRSVEHRLDDLRPILDGRISSGKGKIFVKKMKMSGTSVTDIYAYLRQLEITEGVRPDGICIDYLDLLSPQRGGFKLDNLHLKDKFTAEELYDLSTEYHAQMYTASQLVKESEDKAETDQSAVSGGTPKVNTTDYTILIKRKFGEDRATFTIVKGRDGGEGRIIPVKWNQDTLRISDETDDAFLALNTSIDVGAFKANRAIKAASPIQQAKKIENSIVRQVHDAKSGEMDHDIFARLET